MFKGFTKVVSVYLLLSMFLSAFASVSIFADDVTLKTTSIELGGIDEILASYYDPDGRPMSCAHRAITYIGNQTPENSLQAIQECIDAKVDIVELDIMRTSDGVFVLCHDNSIKRTTTYTGNLDVSAMTYSEICKYPLLKGVGDSDVYYVESGKTLVMPTFEQALDLCRDNCMINLDKFSGQWNYRMDIYDLVKRKGCLKNVMFKGGYSSSQVAAWYSEIKAKYGENAELPTFCVLNGNSDAEKFKSQMKVYGDAKTASAVESSFSNYGIPQTDPAVHSYVHNYMRTFANVLTQSLNSNGFCAGIKEDSTGWSEIIRMGFNILQTNNSADLASYIHDNYSGKPKDISEGINVAHFSDYNHVQNQTTVEMSGKGVCLKNNDWVSFQNVDFSNIKGKKLFLIIQKNASKGSLRITESSLNGSVLANFDLSKYGNGENTLVYELNSPSSEIVNIYVGVSGLGNGESIILNALFAHENPYGNAVDVIGASVFTTPGKAPKMPEKIKVMTNLGYVYESEVIWGQIPAECYASSMNYFKVPGALKGTNERVYAEVSVLSADMSNVAYWFDANNGVVKESGHVSQWIDKIGGIKAVSSSVSSRPAYSQNRTNNEVFFDGVDDYLTFSNDLNAKKNLTFITYSSTDMASTDYLSNYAINNSARYTLLHYPESANWGSVWFSTFKNGVVCRFGSGVDGNRGIYYQTQANGWTVSAATKNGTNELIYLNGNLVYDRTKDTSGLHNAGTAGNAIANTHSYAYIGFGIQNSTNYFYKGSARDIIVFNRTLSSQEISEVSKYLKAKSEGGLNDYSDIVLNAYETTLILKSNSSLKLDKKVIYNFGAEKTATELLSHFENKNITVFNAENTAVSENTRVGTGYTVKVIVNGAVTDAATIVIKGDVDGNGMVDSTDYMNIKSMFLKRVNLTGAYFTAADCDGTGAIDSTDYAQMKAHFLGSFNLYPDESDEPSTDYPPIDTPQDAKGNFAQNKKYTLSGKLEYNGGLSDNGVILTDGVIPDGEIAGQTVVFAGTNAVNTILIDLENVYSNINEIVIGGVRVNGNRQYANVVIELSSDDVAYSVVSNYSVSNTLTNPTGTYNYSYKLSSNATGRYVRITFTSEAYILTLGEVEVYGR